MGCAARNNDRPLLKKSKQPVIVHIYGLGFAKKKRLGYQRVSTKQVQFFYLSITILNLN